ncbi:MAG TPA: hypothetical protein VNB94_00585 [Mycobacteriales bacterium]|nr:hypothetical protein [Mycobacteriales bacterium]
MEHVVFYTGLDSTSQFRRVPSLDEAVRFVESLRNGEGVDDSVVFAMTQVPLRFQTYYRVELPTDASSAAADTATKPPVEPARDEPAPAVEPPPLTDALTAAPAPDLGTAPVAQPRTEAPVEVEAPAAAPDVVPPPVVESVPEQVFEPAPEPTATPEMPAIEAITPAPVLPDASGDVVEPSANGKPNRGLGFFAR